jgi:hypothetical protein
MLVRKAAKKIKVEIWVGDQRGEVGERKMKILIKWSLLRVARVCTKKVRATFRPDFAPKWSVV